MKPIPFSQLLHAFFHDWLVQQRNVSHHTVLSYRDSWRLFLRFVAAEKKKSVAKLGLGDLNAAQVLAFLEDIEQVRKSSIGTRNCRLGALHSFFAFVADRAPRDHPFKLTRELGFVWRQCARVASSRA